jgi:PIN domain nuclease of toxin-antitoxin system
VSVCLDSWAVLAWLDGDEPSLSRVDGLEAGVMSWVNAVEVYYRIERDHGRARADEVMRSMRTVFDLDLPGPACMIETARLKSGRAIALGDCFAIATATMRGLPLLTGDPEILAQPDLPCAVEDLRPA